MNGGFRISKGNLGLGIGHGHMGMHMQDLLLYNLQLRFKLHPFIPPSTLSLISPPPAPISQPFSVPSPSWNREVKERHTKHEGSLFPSPCYNPMGRIHRELPQFEKSRHNSFLCWTKGQGSIQFRCLFLSFLLHKETEKRTLEGTPWRAWMVKALHTPTQLLSTLIYFSCYLVTILNLKINSPIQPSSLCVHQKSKPNYC
jgi:hypothetical protein